MDAQVRGTGVGLSVVRHAVAAHHGTIAVDSRVGEGTVVTVTLPIAVSANAPLDPERRASARPSRVRRHPDCEPRNSDAGQALLLVEDEAGLRLTLSDRLGSEGYLVATASDGEVGLAEAATGSYDVIVLDVMLPRINGFDVCREVRRRGVATPILMLTARGQVVDKVVGLKLGADDYLTKPFEAVELMARLEALLRRAPPSLDPGGDVYRFGAVCVDFRKMEVDARACPSICRRSSSSCCVTSSRIAVQRCHETRCWRTCGATTRCR